MTEHPPPENLPTVAAMLEALDDDDERVNDVAEAEHLTP